MQRGVKRLHRFERRMLRLLEKAGRYGDLLQIGYSRRGKQDLRFPIYALRLGRKSALRKNPVCLVAGVHGLETIGIRVLLDSLEVLIDENSPYFLEEIAKGKVGVVVVPALNPGGVVARTRANPAGVDLMRNSGIEAENPVRFFGGHRISARLPYYRGYGLEPESRALYRLLVNYMFNVKNRILPVLDIHSGYGTQDRVWWPYAYTTEPSVDEALFEQIASSFQACGHNSYEFGPQSRSYTTHGDLWDMLYLKFFEYVMKSGNGAPSSRFLPLTLELGTWSELFSNPLRLFDRKKIFNPPKESKRNVIESHLHFLADFIKLGGSRPKDWC